MSEDSTPDRKVWLRFLKRLQNPSPDRVVDRLSDLIDDLPDVRLTHDPEGSSTFSLREGTYLRIEETDSLDAQFYRWWVREFRNRRRRNTDALTGLANRSTWERQLQERVAKRESAWVVLADVDHFKRFNDRYGHDTGDDVLAAVGTFLSEELLEDDIAVRYGGEEFLVVPIGGESVPGRMESLRADLGGSTLFEDQPEPVTLSMGLAQYEGGGEPSLVRAIERADRALYHSKAEGRDRSTRFAPYLRHKERWSIWGFYRYLDEPDCRFWPGPGNQFVISRGDRIFEYDWLRDERRVLGSDADVTHPLKRVVYAGEAYWFLDRRDRVWSARSGTLHRVGGRREEHPRVVELIAAGDGPLGVALDNGLYELGNDPSRTRSLPARWDHVAYPDSLFIVRGDRLIRVAESGVRCGWDVPECPRQLISLEKSLIVLGEAGNLYRFDPAVGRWIQVLLPDFNGNRVIAREIAGHGRRLLIRDSRDRLLYLGRKYKAVPQSMQLERDPCPG